MTLTFDALTHTYEKDGTRVPSVTQVLDMMTDLSAVPEDRLEYARARGDAVHVGCELYDQDTLDWDTVSKEQEGYIEAWIRFRAEARFVPDLIEQRIFHPGLMYAGTCDRTGTLKGVRCVLDIKAVAKVYPTTGPQTAAYKAGLEAMGHEPFPERYGVQLRKDGTYRLHHYTGATDFGVFVSALTLRNWANRNQHKVHYEPGK